ncbi:hypothetical protein EV383_4414 [Pseudonocardia sediminis]|uniref:Uncharacterized protein n=1 Tax=Pseudonocardia sediminis TaxID=1397368 RepID=A0A4Q7V4F2_PSEST|nr:hypothetical protein EV383_4414 [Pseudonocardia sediminis]
MCESEGLTIAEDFDATWGGQGQPWVSCNPDFGGDVLEIVSVERADDSDVATIYVGALSSLLLAAIRSAREETP